MQVAKEKGTFKMHSFLALRDLHEPLYRSVMKMHAEAASQHDGHSPEHDASVAMMGVRLVESATDEEINGFDPMKLIGMVYVAGLLHSTDRKVGNEEHTEQALWAHLADSDFCESDKIIIVEAVLRHFEFKMMRVETRHPVQKFLMDADKLINLQTLVVVRSGQFHPGIPAIEPEFIGMKPEGTRYYNPATTYKAPRSCLDDLLSCAEWAEPGWMHSKEAIRRAQLLGQELMDFIRRAQQIYIELGLAGVRL